MENPVARRTMARSIPINEMTGRTYQAKIIDSSPEEVARRVADAARQRAEFEETMRRATQQPPDRPEDLSVFKNLPENNDAILGNVAQMTPKDAQTAISGIEYCIKRHLFEGQKLYANNGTLRTNSIETYLGWLRARAGEGS